MDNTRKLITPTFHIPIPRHLTRSCTCMCRYVSLSVLRCPCCDLDAKTTTQRGYLGDGNQGQGQSRSNHAVIIQGFSITEVRTSRSPELDETNARVALAICNGSLRHHPVDFSSVRPWYHDNTAGSKSLYVSFFPPSPLFSQWLCEFTHNTRFSLCDTRPSDWFQGYHLSGRHTTSAHHATSRSPSRQC